MKKQNGDRSNGKSKKQTNKPSSANRPIAPHKHIPGAEARALQEQQAICLRRAKISELYLSGWTLTDISTHLGESLVTIGKDMEWLREQWRQQSTIPFEQQLSDELARLQRLERIANEALSASRQGTTKTREVNKMVLGLKKGKGRGKEEEEELEEEMIQASNKGKKGKGKGSAQSPINEKSAQLQITGEVKPVESSEEHTTSAGDPRWARQVQDVIELRAKLLGLIGGDVVNNNTNVTLDWQTLIQSGGTGQGVESVQAPIVHQQLNVNTSPPSPENLPTNQQSERTNSSGQSAQSPGQPSRQTAPIPRQQYHDATDPIQQRIKSILPVAPLQQVANAEGFAVPNEVDPAERIQQEPKRPPTLDPFPDEDMVEEEE